VIIGFCWHYNYLRLQADKKEKKANNVMRNLRIEKLIINICVGESGDRLTRAAKVLDQLTGQQPVYSRGEYPVLFPLPTLSVALT